MRKKREVPRWKAADRAFDVYRSNVGHSPRERLAWALSRVERSPQEYTPGAFQDLLIELALFAGFQSRVPGHKGISGSPEDEEIDHPTEKEAWEILKIFDQMLTAAIDREAIDGGAFRIREKAWWLEWPKGSRALGRKRDQYILDIEVLDDVEWKSLARRALTHALVEAGHLLKVCPAPAPRGEAGETCERWFVAKRPNQEYCSATCQTRASTRAARKGEETPVVRKRRERAASKRRR